MSFENNEGPEQPQPSTPTDCGPSNPLQDEVNSSRGDGNNHHHLQPFPVAGEYVPPVSSMNISPPGRVSGLPDVAIVDNEQSIRMGAGGDSRSPGPWSVPSRNPPESTLRVSGGAHVVPTVILNLDSDKK